MTYSVCIPIYKQTAIELARELSKQAQNLDPIKEILIIDDGSGDNWENVNQEILDFKKVKLEVLKNNIGRSAIRNFLAQKATGKYLIFLDGDSEIIKPDFLKNYIEFPVSEVLVGGRIYSKEPIENFELHWKYGRLKESKPASIRNLNPHSNFHSNNFLIDKKLFQSIGFEEKLSQYGHEDTLFGFRLEEGNHKIDHFDNPVLHGTLDKNEEFLIKTELGLQNLLVINSLEAQFKEKSSILKLYLKMKSLGLGGVFKTLFRTQKRSLSKNLIGKNPSLKKFNLYKLYYLFSIS